MSAVYAFVIAVFVYSRHDAATDVPQVLLGSANMSAMILYIVTNAVLFSFLMTSEQIPQAMTALDHLGRASTWIEFLLFVNILLLVAGNVMEPSSIVLITAPILFPVAVKLGIHPVHLGILDDRQHGGRHVPSAGRPQPLRRLGHRQAWASPSSPIAVLPWLGTMLVFLGARDLRPRIVAVAAAAHRRLHLTAVQ